MRNWTIISMILLISALGFAQDTAQCYKNCCETEGLATYSGGYCDINPDSAFYEDYTSCVSNCILYDSGGPTGNPASTGFCCMPGALLLGIVGFAAYRSR